MRLDEIKEILHEVVVTLDLIQCGGYGDSDDLGNVLCLVKRELKIAIDSIVEN